MSSQSSSPHQVAIITGASSGIGRAASIALSHAGWAVVLFARTVSGLEETAKQCTGPTLVVAGQVTNEQDVASLFSKSVQTFGRVDLLFNNAGIAAPATPIEDMSLQTFTRVLDVNLVGSFLCTRAAVRQFKAQSPQGGRIINNGSLAAHSPRPHSIPYTTSKHAVSGLTKSTALDGRAHDIAVTQIDIGNALTGLVATRDAKSGHAEMTFDVKHVADTIVHIAGLPLDVQILDINIMARDMPFVGRG